MKFFNKKNFLILLLSLLVGGILFTFYVLFFRPKETSTEFYQLDKNTNQFKKVSITSPEPNITQFGPVQPGNSHSLTRILKGYYHEYDANQQILELKNEFMEFSYLQLLKTSTSQLEQFYCWPGLITDQSGPIQVKSMEFYIYPDARDIIMPNEEFHSIEQLGNFLKKDHYLIIQLQNSFQLNNDNQVQKLILLDC